MTSELLTAADVVQGGGEDVFIVPRVSALHSRSVAVGTAMTCSCNPADNLALHRALATAPPGSVLVCDAGGRLDGGYMGELMATDAINQRIQGLVISGSVRDTALLEELGFAVFCMGRAIPSCRKESAGSYGEPIVIEGVPVAPGDQVIADPDGVVIVPRDKWPAVEARARAVQENERKIAARIASGTRISEVLSLID
jgi:4-hydroxy-4-methyl-2-oxoglutarate aldolase